VTVLSSQRHIATAGAVLALALLVSMLPVAGRSAVILLAFAPLAEELIFREGLQAWLWRLGWGTLAANVAVALMFGLAHALLRSAWLGLGVLLPAYLLGLVYTRTRHVGWCVALHALMNAAWCLFSLGTYS
jgi:membrane protease YdiL (CAAX protease family)